MKGKSEKTNYRTASVALTAGLLVGTGLSASQPVIGKRPAVFGHLNNDDVVHAQTITRKNTADDGLTRKGGTSVRGIPTQTSYIYFGCLNSGWPYSLHYDFNEADGGSFVYCINIGLVDGGNFRQRAAYGPDGKFIMSTDGIPAAISGDELKKSGIINLLYMSGHRGYQGLTKWSDDFFFGRSPESTARVNGINYNRYPGSFYALMMEFAIHYCEAGSFYASAGGAGLGYSNDFHNGVDRLAAGGGHGIGAPTMYVHDPEKGDFQYSAQDVARNVKKLVDYARTKYQAPSIDNLTKQTFTVDVQGWQKPYEHKDSDGNPTSDKNKFGSWAETVKMGDKKDGNELLSVKSESDGIISVKSESDGIDGINKKLINFFQQYSDHDLKDDKIIGTAPIAITGSNLDKYKASFTLGTPTADPDFQDQGLTIHSHAMPQDDVLCFQISQTPARTGNDTATKVPGNNIQWQPEFHKLTDPIDFSKLNGHYIRLIVDNNDNQDDHAHYWNGANAIPLKMTISIPAEHGSVPLAVEYTTYSPGVQKYTSTNSATIEYSPVAMNSNMIFHVRQKNSSTTPNKATPMKRLHEVPKTIDTITGHFNDKHLDETKNKPEIDTFSDGFNSKSPEGFKHVTKQQSDSIKGMLSQAPITVKNTKGLIPGKEYAYTIPLVTGRNILKHGSEEIESLQANDVQLPKWFVYKTAAVTVGSSPKTQELNNDLTDASKITYKPKADGSGSLKFHVDRFHGNAKLNNALKPAITSDDGEVDLTIFGTVDPNTEEKTSLPNFYESKFSYDTREKYHKDSTPKTPGVKHYSSDIVKGILVGGPTEKTSVDKFLTKVNEINPTFGKTAGITPSGNSTGHLSLASDNLKISRIRSLNTNMTADKTGDYGQGSKIPQRPKEYDKILTKSVTIKNPEQQKNLYYVMIANSGNGYGPGHENGFNQLHFSDYLDPNLKLDLKHRPMVAYDLSQMEPRKSGAGDTVLAPFSQKGQFATQSTGNVQSYMSNLIFDTSNQLSKDGLKNFGVTDESKKAMVNGLSAYVNPTDMKAWNDGVGKVGSRNYSKYYRANNNGRYHDYTNLGLIEDDNGKYDENASLDGAGNEKGWYSFSHGSVEGGSTQSLRDLDGRQRISWTVNGETAEALSDHTLMFMVPVKVKDNATYVTNNNQTPDIQNDAYFGGKWVKTPNGGGNPTSDSFVGKMTDHGNGAGYSNTVTIHPIRKDMITTKTQKTDNVGFTKSAKHENFDDKFSFKMNIRMPNWADKNNLQDMHGKAAKFQIYDNMALPYDVKNVSVYDETDHKTLVPNLKSGLADGQIALDKQSKWDSSKATQHPRLVYRPYGNVTSNHPQAVFRLANHKLIMKVKVDAPFEQGETNKRLGHLSNALTDAKYDKYMEEHKTGTHEYSIPNTLHVTHQSTVDDHNDGSHESNKVITKYGDKFEMSVDAMRIDTTKLDPNGQSDNFKLFFSTKMPFGTHNDDASGNVRVKITADRADNPHLNQDLTLYNQKMALNKLTSVDQIRSFTNHEGTIKKYQQGSQGVGKYTLNGRLNTSGMSNSAAKYYNGFELKDKHGSTPINYLKATGYDNNGAVTENDSAQTYSSHRHPLYVRVKVSANEQNLNRDLSINGDRSFRGKNGRMINPFHDGMVGRADFAYKQDLDPRFATISPEASYSYFGQNRTGEQQNANSNNASAHKGVSVIQTLYDATQLHRFDKQGNPTKNQGNVDQTIGAGAGDGIRNDVRLQRFGWGYANAKSDVSKSTSSPKQMMRANKLEFIFDPQLENGSGVKYKDASAAKMVKPAMANYYRSTGANATANWDSNGSFWTFHHDGDVDFHQSRAKVNGYDFASENANKLNYKRDMLHANTDSETVKKGTGDAQYYTVPRATEHDEALQSTTSVYGSPVGKYLTNLQSSSVVIDGHRGIGAIKWQKNGNGYLADNRAKNIVINNQSGITSIDNAPNSKTNNDAAKNYGDKKSNDELATDAGNFFASDIGNNYKNYQFYTRELKRGTGQVAVKNGKQVDSDVMVSRFTDNARGKKLAGTVNGHEKFYLPMWFTNNDEHDTFSNGTGEADINPLIYYSNGDVDRINADYSGINFTRWLRIFGHRYGFDGSNSGDYDSMLISGKLGGKNSTALNDHENEALNNAQDRNRDEKVPHGMTE